MAHGGEDPELADMAVVSSSLKSRVTELTASMTALLTEQIPDLPQDPVTRRMLAESVESNLRLAAQVYGGEIGVGDIRAPHGAREYARRLAQYEVAPTALIRAYRLGQHIHVTWAVDELVRAFPDPVRALAAARTLLSVNFRYIDLISEQVIEDYQAERERWLAHRSTVRTQTLERLLAAESVDAAAAESTLGLRLRQHHIAAVLWTAGGHDSPSDLRVLESAAGRLGEAVGATGAPLVWPKDRSTLWIWFPVGRQVEPPDPARTEAALDGIAPRILGGLGAPGFGVTGFRQSHEDALQAAQVATIGGGRPRRLTCYTEPGVRTAALLAADLAGTRRLVSSSLGGLDARTDSAARLRETLLVFLDERRSHVAAAQRLHLHKNTVKYRVAKAVEQRGRPLDEDQLDLQLALIACHWLGQAVLPAAETS
ncbi:PucR family transcriptional regulator [Streptomyces sp. NPDC004059]